MTRHDRPVKPVLRFRAIFSKNGLLALAVAAVVMYLFIPVPSQRARPGPGVTVLRFWHPWAGEYADALTEVVAEFNRTHPSIHVDALFMPTGAGENMKFFVSAAGGAPPDVIVVDGTQVASWADTGVLRPLDDRLAAAGITEDDFWAPCWQQCRYNDRTWALSAAADPNFSLVWNKHLFREAERELRAAGLDPERPPRTLRELEKYCEKLTKLDENGRILQAGFVPTYMFSGELTLLTWGWAFGGSFYDPQRQAFTCDDPRIIKAVKWLLHMRDFYGGQTKVLGFQEGFQDAAQSPFYIGKLAMHVSYIADTQNIAKFAPNLEYGIAPLPGPEDGEIGMGWIGGWAMAIPYGPRGHEDEAFEFIRWMTADPVGTTFVSRRMRLLPAYRKSPFFDTDVPGDPILEAYDQILRSARHARPVTPANAFYMNELRRALGRSLQDLLTPEEALQQARDRTTRYSDRIRARAKAGYTQG